MTPKQSAYELTANHIIKNLEKRNMEGYFYASKEELAKNLFAKLQKGSVIGWGGSESFIETGLLDMLKNDGSFTLLDRNAATTPEGKREIYAKTVMADYYFMSTNAITLDGELFNIDGNGNRVACLIQGPSIVYVIVGMNKVTKDIESAITRAKVQACPANNIRLGRKTPCATTGVCGDCFSPDCICNQYVITRRSGHPGRIKVLLVGEELGY